MVKEAKVRFTSLRAMLIWRARVETRGEEGRLWGRTKALKIENEAMWEKEIHEVFSSLYTSYDALFVPSCDQGDPLKGQNDMALSHSLPPDRSAAGFQLTLTQCRERKIVQVEVPRITSVSAGTSRTTSSTLQIVSWAEWRPSS